jgi:hypothetical protein
MDQGPWECSTYAGVLPGAQENYVPFPEIPRTTPEALISPLEILHSDSLVWRMILVLMIAGTGMVMILPAFLLVEVRQLGLSSAQIGILLAVNSLVFTVMGEILGRKLSESPARVVNAFRLGMLSIIGMAGIYATGKLFWLLLVANILCGIGGSANSVCWRLFAIKLNYCLDVLPGLHLLTCGIRGLCAPALGVFLITLWSPATALWVATGLVLAGILMLPTNRIISIFLPAV